MNSAPLSPLEAGFLYAESPFTPMHIGSVSIYDGTPWRAPDGKLRLETLTEHSLSKLAAIPRLRQYPVWPLGRAGRPRWVDDRSFEIGRHVNMVSLPPPGSEAQLLALIEELNMMLLDRSHPLWELWFIDGLEGGRVALLEKIHHSLVDGIGGVDLAMMLLDVEPKAPETKGNVEINRNSVLDRFLPLVWAVETAMEVPVSIGKDLTALATHPMSAIRRGRQLTGAAFGLLGDLFAPSTSLNEEIGGRRRYRVIRRSVEDVRRTAHAFGGSINDVVLAAASAGLHDVMAARRDPLVDVHALVPVSIRAEDQHDDLGNRVAALIVPLPTRDLEPPDRIAAVRSAVRRAREHHQVELSHAILTVMQTFPEPLVASVAGLMNRQPLFNLVVTNVPGPPVPLYLMGSEMLEAFPLVPLARNLTVSIGILSYHDHLTLGIWADLDRFADIDLLVDGIEDGFATLEKAAGGVME